MASTANREVMRGYLNPIQSHSIPFNLIQSPYFNPFRSSNHLKSLNHESFSHISHSNFSLFFPGHLRPQRPRGIRAAWCRTCPSHRRHPGGSPIAEAPRRTMACLLHHHRSMHMWLTVTSIYIYIIIYIYIYVSKHIFINIYIIYIWVNYTRIQPTWIKAIWAWFPLLTMIFSEVAERSL